VTDLQLVKIVCSCARFFVALGGLLAGLSGTGCSYLGSATAFDPAAFSREEGWLRVPDVPVFAQKGDEDCGTAALAMVLAHCDRTVSAEEIGKACLPAGCAGAKAGDLRDFAKGLGLQAYLFRGEVADFERELSRGRPVLVGLVKPHVGGPMAHYEVVVAFHPVRGDVVTLDPARGWSRNTLPGFLQEWEPAGCLTLLVFREKDVP
jgi:ABC-type bacteriocin/lantibiotic exporter with double-glycine peptidase domain